MNGLFFLYLLGFIFKHILVGTAFFDCDAGNPSLQISALNPLEASIPDGLVNESFLLKCAFCPLLFKPFTAIERFS